MSSTDNSTNLVPAAVIDEFKRTYCQPGTGVLDAWSDGGFIAYQLDPNDTNAAMDTLTKIPTDFRGHPLIATWFPRDTNSN